MNIRDLRYLIAVAEHKHFGHAAKACFISQPTLSMQIKKLEDELGVQLLERSQKQVMLTEVGVRIIELAKRILRTVDDIKAIAKASQDPYAGQIRLGIIPTIGPYLLPQIIPPLSKTYPKLKILLHEGKTNEIVDNLKEGSLDAIILALPIDEPDLVSYELFKEPFLAAVSKHHALAKRSFIKAEDLKTDHLLLLEEGHCLRNQALDVCHHDISIEMPNFRATSLETLRHMVAADVGITLMPEMACDDSYTEIRFLQFRKPKPYRTIGMMWRKSSIRTKVLEEIAVLCKTGPI